MPLIRHNRFALFCMLAGILALAAISYLQSHFILGIPLALGNFIIPSLVGGITGLFIGRSYFRLQDRERALREAEGRLQTILESVHAGIILVDASSHTIVEANKAALQMLKGTRQQVVGAHCRHFFCPTEPEGCPITDLGQEADSSERLMRDLEGRQIPILKTATTVVIHGVPHLLESFVDITERKLAEQEIQQLAYYDTLTGLPNRALLKDRLQQALALSARENLLLAVIFLDLDHFKLVNDTLGHSNGDQLLRTVAERLQGCIRRSDTVARLGGDEFVAVLSGVQGEEGAALLAQKILETIGEPLELAGQEVFSSCSIGIALYPGDGGDVDTLLKNADAAMYQAKEQGRSTFQFFSRELNRKSADRLALETGLRRSLERKDFLLHYQPQIDLQTGLVVGVEALLRWHHPELGPVPPARFIPLAEETGLIIPLGEWVIRTACAQSRAWQEAGYPPLRMAINLSLKQFRQKNLLAVVSETLAETGLNPACLELELTESSIMEHSEHTLALLSQLKGMGVHLSIDDFGTGFSSMGALKLLPIHRLKIAQQFVRDILTDPDDAAITDAVIAMAHSLKLTVLAEGVESREQMDYLRQRQCDEAQGFYFAPPMAAHEFATFISRGWGGKNTCFFAGGRGDAPAAPAPAAR
jgi:diguanylate cyclase (GGDEF)-like protein/PAS domain S-box-containing protein